jgi:hypothetical protein
MIFEDESRSLSPDSLPSTVLYNWSNGHPSIGQKRNKMCSFSLGSLIAHWDDDDWHAPNRLSTQVAKMQHDRSRLCGVDRLVFYDNERAWLHQSVRRPSGGPWLAGGTLVYERSLWQELGGFQEVSDGEDTAFVDEAYKRNTHVSVITDPSLYVAQLHDGNTTKRNMNALGSGFDVERVREWMSGNQRGSHART